MINAKDAYSKAAQYFKELVGDYECELEEIELSSNYKFWMVTLSYYEKKSSSDSINLLKVLKKLAKTITINSEDGSFFSMKIRNYL
jgi:hypothetical protein